MESVNVYSWKIPVAIPRRNVDVYSSIAFSFRRKTRSARLISP
jgi:hypothetical protein